MDSNNVFIALTIYFLALMLGTTLDRNAIQDQLTQIQESIVCDKGIER